MDELQPTSSAADESRELLTTDVADFLCRSIGELQTMAPSDRQTWKQPFIKRDGSRCWYSQGNRPDFATTIALASRRDELPSISSFARSLEIDPRLKAIAASNPTVQWYHLTPDAIAESTLTGYVLELPKLEHDAALAMSVAETLIESLDRGTSEIVFVSVVGGLHCEFESRSLPDGTKLRTLDDAEILRLASHYPQLVMREMVPQNRVVLERRLIVPLADPNPGDDISVREDFLKVLSALRSFKDGQLEFGMLHCLSDRPGQITPALSSTGTGFRRIHVGRTYSLTPSEFTAVERLWKTITSPQIPQNLRIAIDRVGFAAERTRLEDGLVDDLIALEALFGDGGGAIRYKLGIRCAVFLETEFDARKRLMKLVNDGYRLRSKLVHGEGGDPPNAKLVSDLAEVVRRAIREMSDHVQSGRLPPVAKDLDELILRGRIA